MANRKRNNSVILRLNDEEFAELTKRSEQCKLTKQEYLLRCSLQKEIVVVNEGSEILKQLIRIGTNINQIAKVANSTSKIDLEKVEDLKREVGLLWQQLRL